MIYFPLFGALTKAANPALGAAQARAPVSVTADPARCSVQFDPIGKTTFDKTSCDIAKSFLARKAGIPYANEAAPAGTIASVKIGDKVIQGFDVTGLPGRGEGQDRRADEGHDRRHPRGRLSRQAPIRRRPTRRW